MQLVKFTTDDNPVFINPEFRGVGPQGHEGHRDPDHSGAYTVKEAVEVVVRLLGAEELARDVTPALPSPKTIDI